MGIAVFAVDPGGKSGVAWGWFNDEADSVKAAIRRARKKGSFGAAELGGDMLCQAWWIAQHWMAFRYKSNVEYRMPLTDIHFVMESFQLRQMAVDLAPVQVGYATLALLQGGSMEKIVGKKTDEQIRFMVVPDSKTYPLGEPIMQAPSDAMTYATDKRLKEWGAWVVGSPHMRDATRHVLLKLSTELE